MMPYHILMPWHATKPARVIPHDEQSFIALFPCQIKTALQCNSDALAIRSPPMHISKMNIYDKTSLETTNTSNQRYAIRNDAMGKSNRHCYRHRSPGLPREGFEEEDRDSGRMGRLDYHPDPKGGLSYTLRGVAEKAEVAQMRVLQQ